MIFIEGISTDPHFNLAMEQYVFDSFDRSEQYFMLWQNHNAIIIGKNQNTIEEINQAYVKEHDISVVRRLSGGGAVYHDLGNLNYTLIMDRKDNDKLDFQLFTEPVAKVLNDMGIAAEVNGRNDITIDGKKFSGNAQYVKGGRIMHHGTIMYDSDLSVVGSALKVSRDKIESKGVKSVASRVTNIKEHMENPISIEEFKKKFVEGFLKHTEVTRYSLSEEDIEKINRIKEERYDKWEWNYGDSPRCNILKERRFENCGKIELYIVLNKGRITEISSRGDYFGSGDFCDLKEKLVGCPLSEDALNEVLAGVDIGYYYNNLTQQDFIDLMLT